MNERWRDEGLPSFELGIGVTSGPVAAALLGSEEHLEYTLVGDTVNLSQRLQQWAEPGETVLSETTYARFPIPPRRKHLPPALVKGAGHARVGVALPASTVTTATPAA